MMKDIYVYTPLDIRNTVSRVLKDVSDYVTEEYAFAIRLVLNELLANSVVHSKGTRTKLSYKLEAQQICCAISDDGEWYCAKDVDCPSVEEDHGRGIFLASCYADMLRYDEEGHRLCFKIRYR